MGKLQMRNMICMLQDVCFISMMHECFMWSDGCHSLGVVYGMEETLTRHQLLL